MTDKDWSSMYVRSFVFESGSPPPVGCRLPGCFDPEPLVMTVLMGATAVALVAFVALVYLRRAEDVLEEEYDRTVAECDAFREFARRVEQLDGTAATTSPSSFEGGILSRSPAPDDRLERVRDAYRSTVMGVAHYEEEYDDTLAESMAVEFCEEVATVVRNGPRFSAQLKGALLQGSKQSRAERSALIGVLDRERDALECAGSEFGTVYAELERMDDRPLGEKTLTELGADWDRLSELDRRCRDVLVDRQDRIHTGYPDLPDRTAGVRFHEYLYGPLSVTNPVLAEGAELAAVIGTARRRILSTARARP